MGRILFAMNMSLDGFITNTAGEISFPVPGPELHKHFNELMRDTVLALCGRRLYDAMSYWDSPDDVIGNDPVALEFARYWRETPKVVFSTTLTEVGPNARLVQGRASCRATPPRSCARSRTRRRGRFSSKARTSPANWQAQA